MSATPCSAYGPSPNLARRKGHHSLSRRSSQLSKKWQIPIPSQGQKSGFNFLPNTSPKNDNDTLAIRPPHNSSTMHVYYIQTNKCISELILTDTCTIKHLKGQHMRHQHYCHKHWVDVTYTMRVRVYIRTSVNSTRSAAATNTHIDLIQRQQQIKSYRPPTVEDVANEHPVST